MAIELILSRVNGQGAFVERKVGRENPKPGTNWVMRGAWCVVRGAWCVIPGDLLSRWLNFRGVV